MRPILVAVAILVLWPAPVRAGDPFQALDLMRPGPPTAAPDFTVARLGGGVITLHQLKGQVVFLNFWATWCPPCKQEMPSMERLYRRYQGRPFTIVAISIDTDGAASVAPFVKKFGLTFPIGLDSKLEVANRYMVRALPTTVLVDASGRTVALALGPREWDGPAGRAIVERLLH